MSEHTMLVSKEGHRIVFTLQEWQSLWCLAHAILKFSREECLKGIYMEGGHIDEATAVAIANGVRRVKSERGWSGIDSCVPQQTSETTLFLERNVASFLEFCESSGGFNIVELE